MEKREKSVLCAMKSNVTSYLQHCYAVYYPGQRCWYEHPSLLLQVYLESLTLPLPRTLKSIKPLKQPGTLNKIIFVSLINGKMFLKCSIYLRRHPIWQKKKSVVDYKKMQTTMVPNPSSCLLHLSQAWALRFSHGWMGFYYKPILRWYHTKADWKQTSSKSSNILILPTWKAKAI